MRNWLTPLRSQPFHASSADSGGGAASRSSTVTSWPSRASNIALVSPPTPPPITTIRAIPHPFRRARNPIREQFAATGRADLSDRGKAASVAWPKSGRGTTRVVGHARGARPTRAASRPDRGRRRRCRIVGAERTSRSAKGEAQRRRVVVVARRASSSTGTCCWQTSPTSCGRSRGRYTRSSPTSTPRSPGGATCAITAESPRK